MGMPRPSRRRSGMQSGCLGPLALALALALAARLLALGHGDNHPPSGLAQCAVSVETTYEPI